MCFTYNTYQHTDEAVKQAEARRHDFNTTRKRGRLDDIGKINGL